MSTANEYKNVNDEDIKEYHRKRLLELSLKSIEALRDIPELEEPTYEQKEWLVRKMKRSFT